MGSAAVSAAPVGVPPTGTNVVRVHEGSAGRRTRQARRPRSPSHLQVPGPIHVQSSEVFPAQKPTPSPLPGGEPEAGCSNESPLLGGAGGGFMGAKRDQSSGSSHFDFNFMTVMEYAGSSRVKSALKPLAFDVRGTIFRGSSREFVSSRLLAARDTTSPSGSIFSAPLI